jgi:hypothetical protein
MAGTDLLFTEALANPIPALRKDTKPVKSFGSETNLAQSSNLLEQEISQLGAEETRRLTSNIDLTRDLGKMMLKDAEGKNLLAIKEKELQAVHDRERKRIRDELGEKFYNSPDMQEFKKFADESADKMMFVPSQTTAPLLGVVFATIGATGMLLGGLSKNNAKAALSAMNGMAEGFGKGKEDLYKQERQTFDTNVKAMTQRMGILKAKLDVAREKMKYDADAADLEANAAFAEAGADFLKANNDKFGLQDSITKLETQIKQNETWAKLMETKKSAAIKELEAQRFKAHESELTRNQQMSIQRMLESGREERAAADRALRTVIAQGQISSQAQGRAVQLQLAQLRLSEAGTRRDVKALQDIGPALRNIAINYPDGTANNLVGASADDKKKIQGAFRALQESEETADFIAKNPRAVGALAKLRNVIKVDAIQSLKSDDETQTVAGKSAILESQIDAAANKGIVTKDEAEAAKILEKRLFGLALADVQGSGQRGSVYLDRQFQNLYDQASRPDTLLKVIKERSGENNRNLKIYRLGVERHENPELFPLTLSETGSEFNKYLRDRSPGPKEGDENTSSSGKPMVFKNGQWVYKQ